MLQIKLRRPAYRIWISALILGLLFSQVVAPELRGAAVGLEVWIDRADFVSAWLTQVLGVSGSILIVRLLVDALRDTGRRPSSGLVASLGFMPALVMVMAAEGPVFEPLLRLNLLSALLLGALVTLARTFVAPKSALLPTAAVISLASRLLLSSEGEPHLGATILSYLGITATAFVMGFAAWQAFRRPALGRSTERTSSRGRSYGIAFLGALHVSLTDIVDPNWSNLVPRGPTLQTLLACVPLLALYLTWSRKRAREGYIEAALLISCVAPVSPLTTAVATLCFLLMHLDLPPTKSNAIPKA
jgi:hypothetical protein